MCAGAEYLCRVPAVNLMVIWATSWTVRFQAAEWLYNSLDMLLTIHQKQILSYRNQMPSEAAV